MLAGGSPVRCVTPGLECGMCGRDLLIYLLQESTRVLKGNGRKMANVISSDTVFNHMPAPMACTVVQWDPSPVGFSGSSSCQSLTVSWDLSSLFTCFFFCTLVVNADRHPVYERFL